MCTINSLIVPTLTIDGVWFVGDDSGVAGACLAATALASIRQIPDTHKTFRMAAEFILATTCRS
jgi:hypothetical protein